MITFIVTVCANDASNDEQTVEVNAQTEADAIKRAQSLFAIVKSATPKK